MKYIVILGDGMADTPFEGLGGKTPLDVAYKPNIDSLANRSICGMCKTVPDGIKPGSDVANLSVIGYSPLKYYSGRSPLEALSIGVDMADDDLAVRCNLVTLSDEDNYLDKTMVDYSAGEISSEEASELIKAVHYALGSQTFDFYSGVSYRHCLIRHHGERGTEYTPPHDISGRVIGDYLPRGLYGEEMLSLMIASYDILKDHPVNIKRIAEGKNPANSIWLWGEGSKPSLPDFKGLRGLKGAMISAVDLLKGIAIASGMDVIEVEGATGTVKTNFSGKAEACVNAIRNGYDYVYLHMEAPDECGHQGDTEGKVKSIELIDEKVVGYILKELEGEDVRILICPDHPTPLATKTHSSEPIPFVIYDSTCIKDGAFAYTENECKKTGLLLNSGDELVEMFLNKDEGNDMDEKELYESDNSEIVEDRVVEGDTTLESQVVDEPIEQNIDETSDEFGNIDNSDILSEQSEEYVGDIDDGEQDIYIEVANSDIPNEITENNIDAESEVVDKDNAESNESESNESEYAESNKNDIDENVEGENNVDANVNDDEAVPAQGSNMVIASSEGESNSEEQAEGETEKKGKKNQKGGNDKGKMSPKKKKALTIAIVATVLVVIITLSILIPVLVVNAPKVFINSAEDFQKPIKDKKEIIVLQKDITVDGDLTIGLDVDFNKKTLIVNGTLTLEAKNGGEMELGNKSGKEFVGGGSINATNVVIKNSTSVTMFSNMEAGTIKIDHIGKVNFNGSVGAREMFDIESSEVVLNKVEFDETCEELVAKNSSLTLNNPTKIDINLQNSRMYANSDIQNVTLDENAQLRLRANCYNKIGEEELGTITGGKLVYVKENCKAGKIIGAKQLWLDVNSDIEWEDCKVSYTGQLETPQFIIVKRNGSEVHLELSSVDINATKVIVYIDNDAQVLEFDVNNDIISGANGYVYNLGGGILNKVGTHEIKVVLRSNEPEFVSDSDPYYTKHTHFITLDRVGDPKVTINSDGKYVLSFISVDFAESYDVMFDGILLNIKHNKAGEVVSYILSDDEKFKPLLAIPGNHSITIVAKSSVDGINSSEKAYAKFSPIMGNLETPQVTMTEGENDLVVFSWGKIEGAKRYRIELVTATGSRILEVGADKLSYTFTKEELTGATKLVVVAIGDKYYNNSASGEVNITL